VAARKKLVSKSPAGLKAAAGGVGAKPMSNDARSERIVPIPKVAVFSELPFASRGTIGGTGVNIISSGAGSDGTPTQTGKTPASNGVASKSAPKKAAAKKAAPATKKAATKKAAAKTSRSNGSARRAGGRKKTR
jgi:hypothetical protein